MTDDRDIKIYVKQNTDEQNEFSHLTEDISRHKANGNFDKAVSLGTELASVKAEDNIADISDFRFSAAQLYQVRVLLTFIAEYCVQNYIREEFIADTVSRSMYNYLKKNEPGYYDNISDGGAFSFYLLALKKDGDTANNIGEQFAMLCGINKPEMIDLGSRIFNEACSHFNTMIKSMVFDL